MGNESQNNSLLSYIPGFRQNKLSHKIIACFYYFVLLLGLLQGNKGDIFYVLFGLSIPFLIFYGIDFFKTKNKLSLKIVLASCVIFFVSVSLLPSTNLETEPVSANDSKQDKAITNETNQNKVATSESLLNAEAKTADVKNESGKVIGERIYYEVSKDVLKQTSAEDFQKFIDEKIDKNKMWTSVICDDDTGLFFSGYTIIYGKLNSMGHVDEELGFLHWKDDGSYLYLNSKERDEILSFVEGCIPSQYEVGYENNDFYTIDYTVTDDGRYNISVNLDDSSFTADNTQAIFDQICESVKDNEKIASLYISFGYELNYVNSLEKEF